MPEEGLKPPTRGLCRQAQRRVPRVVSAGRIKTCRYPSDPHIEVAKEGLGPRLAFLAGLPYAWRAVGILEPWELLGAEAEAHDDALKPREITDGGSGT
jgi:hypothetical protein